MSGVPFTHRELGLLMHPSCFPGHDDIGTLGAEAYAFVDWLVDTGATIWQILPLTPNGQYDSPYFSFTAFGGNPLLIDLVDLHEAGLVDDTGLHVDVVDDRVDFDTLAARKHPILVAAARRFLADPAHEWQSDYQRFVTAESGWLPDTCHYLAVKQQQGTPWWQWPDPLRRRDAEALAESRAELSETIQTWQAVFFFFERQWAALKRYANDRGIRVLGDLPIYVMHDSVDVWVNQEEYKLDETGHLLVQSGVPPDYFSATGQLWGNPIYRWDLMAKNDFAWWMARLRRCVALSDIVRIDHFRALSAYWEVPGDATTAIDGTWEPGPGQRFFDVLAAAFPTMPFVAEDLGTLDDDVYRLRDENRLYGMRILQFAYDGNPQNPHLPGQIIPESIAYTGTHDNQPVVGWWNSIDEETRRRALDALGLTEDAAPTAVARRLVQTALQTDANLAVIPIQDLLGLDDEHRMNDPGTFVGNWSWRLPADSLSPGLAAELRELAESARRLGQEG